MTLLYTMCTNYSSNEPARSSSVIIEGFLFSVPSARRHLCLSVPQSHMLMCKPKLCVCVTRGNYSCTNLGAGPSEWVESAGGAFSAVRARHVPPPSRRLEGVRAGSPGVAGDIHPYPRSRSTIQTSTSVIAERQGHRGSASAASAPSGRPGTPDT
eukprot:3851406-Prymnesium_polylepis.1